MAKQTSFSGQCPECKGYNSRVRSELINYSQDETAPQREQDQEAIASRTRVFFCNACQHIWSETVEGGPPAQ